MLKSTIFFLYIIYFHSVFGQFNGFEVLGAPCLYTDGVMAVDIDQDGDVDIIGIGAYNQPMFVLNNAIFLYEQIEIGSYKQRILISENFGQINDLSFGDMDNDGDIDIVAISNTENTVLFYENIGEEEFAASIELTNTLMGANFVRIEDVDADGNLDVIATGINDYTVVYFKNLGNNNFSAKQVISSTFYNQKELFVFDLDNDGLKDLIEFSSSSFRWQQNLGQGNFSSEVLLSSTTFTMDYPVTGDMDNDGDLDIISNYNANPTIIWFENNGNATFSGIKPAFSTFGPRALAVGDYDSDGDLDIAVSKEYSTMDTLSWFENNGASIFINEHFISSTEDGSQKKIISNDIDNDGDIDILTSIYNIHGIRSYRNSGVGNFDPRSTLIFHGSKMAHVDINNDGNEELFGLSVIQPTSLNYLGLIENDGTNFQGQRQIINGHFSNAVFADLNNDGYEDCILTTGTQDQSLVYLLNQGGDFEGANLISIGSPPASQGGFSLLSTGDIDGDGDIDIITLHNVFSKLGWYENLGGSFIFHTIENQSFNDFGNIFYLDIDNDGLKDILCVFNEGIYWYKNSGGGTFSPRTAILFTNSNVSKIDARDADNDGDIDILFGSTIIGYLENLGGGMFSPAQTVYPSFSTNSRLKFGDINANGFADAVVLDYNSLELYWIENENGLFNGGVTIIKNNILNPNEIHVYDYDNDSDDDIIISCKVGDLLFKNNTFDPNQFSGIIYYDDNQNSQQDTGDNGLYLVPVQIIGINSIDFSSINGRYNLDFNNQSYGNYQVQPNISNNWTITTTPSIYNVPYNAAYQPIVNADFGVYPAIIEDSIHAELIGGFPRCNNVVEYWVSVRNVGTTLPSGIIELKLDNGLVFNGSSVPADSVVGNQIYWNYSSLFYFEDTLIKVQVQMPDFNSIGDTLTSVLNANITTTSLNFSDTLKQTLVCAYDPNDKIAEPKGIDSLGYIPSSTPFIDYTVRFQNTGNDTAMVVKIKDHLDDNLVWNSLKILSHSHPVDISMNSNGLITFVFNNILLPDSTVDFSGSQGFVKFRVDLKPGLFAETQIKNRAFIYFDQNPAVLTNYALNTIDSSGGNLGLDDIESNYNSFKVYPNPTTGEVSIDFVSEQKNVEIVIYSVRGEVVLKKEFVEGNVFNFDFEGESGVYILKVICQNEVSSVRILKN